MWVYSNDLPKYVEADKFMRKNHEYYANMSGYEIKHITDYNYKDFLPKDVAADIVQSKRELFKAA